MLVLWGIKCRDAGLDLLPGFHTYSFYRTAGERRAWGLHEMMDTWIVLQIPLKVFGFSL